MSEPKETSTLNDSPDLRPCESEVVSVHNTPIQIANPHGSAQVAASHAVLRHIRGVLVDLCIALVRVLFFWLPGGDVAKGHALMIFHYMLLPLTPVIFFMAEAKSPIRILLAGFIIIVALTQWLFGCVITRAEQRLTGSKETVADPFLKLVGICVNRDTLSAATVTAGSTTALILVIGVICDAIR
jgi:hypothetical protein